MLYNYFDILKCELLWKQDLLLPKNVLLLKKEDFVIRLKFRNNDSTKIFKVVYLLVYLFIYFL